MDGLKRRWSVFRMLAEGVRSGHIHPRAAVQFWRAVSFEPPTNADRQWLDEVADREGLKNRGDDPAT